LSDDSEEQLVRELQAAHADQQRVLAEMVVVAQRRRAAVEALRRRGRSQTWIAARIGISKQAVSLLLKGSPLRGG